MVQSKTHGYFKSPVGGIIYKPLEKRDEDIYGEEIALDNLLSYRHAPVQVNEPVQGYQRGQYKWTPPEETESIKQAEETTVAPVRLVIPTSGKVTGSHLIESGVQVGNMQSLLDEAAKHGIYFRVTSGYRPGAKTSSGNQSWHATGDALDITPLEGTSWDDFRNTLKNNPQFLTWMRDNGYGILDETTDEMLAKTGGTGAHFHIGKDQLAIEGLKQFLV